MEEDVRVMLHRIARELGLYSYDERFLSVSVLDGGANFVAHLSPSWKDNREIEVSVFGRGNSEIGEHLREKCVESGYVNSSVCLKSEVSESAYSSIEAHFLHNLYGGNRKVWSGINTFFENGGWFLGLFAPFLLGTYMGCWSAWYWGLLLGMCLFALCVSLHIISVKKLKDWSVSVGLWYN